LKVASSKAEHEELEWRFTMLPELKAERVEYCRVIVVRQDGTTYAWCGAYQTEGVVPSEWFRGVLGRPLPRAGFTPDASHPLMDGFRLRETQRARLLDELEGLPEDTFKSFSATWTF
jgi:hypothetical protein